MCQPKSGSGLRCPKHAKETLTKAEASGNTQRIAKATYEWELTEPGIQELRTKGDHFSADLRQSERDTLISNAAKKRDNELQAISTIKDSGKLDELCRSKDVKVRAAAAANEHLPINFQFRLAWVNNDTVHKALLANPKLDHDILLHLAFNGSNKIRGLAEDKYAEKMKIAAAAKEYRDTHDFG